MHELSLAQNIVDSVREHVGNDRLPLVTRVTVEIGAASGVVAESLLYAFEAIVQGTPLSKAKMETALIPFTVHCHTCCADSENGTGFMTCGRCDSLDVSVLSGTEMILKQIELIDE